jgi:hypothetical protein
MKYKDNKKGGRGIGTTEKKIYFNLPTNFFKSFNVVPDNLLFFINNL